MSVVKSCYQLRLTLFCLLFVVHVVTYGQSSNTSSPYSRYGIGDLIGKGFAQGYALGGSHIALQNDSIQMFFINSGNPASYSNVRLTTAELGMNYTRMKMENSSAKNIAHNAALAYVSLAFPIKKWWGSSIGILPYSSVGYAISDHRDLSSAGDVEYLYEGSGGINQVYFGNSFKPLYGVPGAFVKSKRYARLKEENKTTQINRILKRKTRAQGLSLGMNVSYLFGNIENSKRSIFQPAFVAFNTRSIMSTRISDVYLDYGMQYAFTIDSLHGRDLKDNVKIMMGATFSTQTNVDARIDTLTYSYYYGSTGEEVFKDTVKLSTDTKGKMTFPLSFGFGLGFRKGDRWLAVADFAIQNWSSYEAFNQPQGLKNSMRISAGVQYTPNAKYSNSKNLIDGYYKRVQYRIGGRYAKTALELRSTQLKEYALTIGAGLPVGRNFLLQNFSMVNIGVELGQRGTISNGLIRENFMKVSIGFTINDRWFVKPKID